MHSVITGFALQLRATTHSTYSTMPCTIEFVRKLAPQVGLEPTTDRLTADNSTIELLWINA